MRLPQGSRKSQRNGDELDPIFVDQLLSHLRELLLVANQDSKMPPSIGPGFFHLEHGEKLMFAQLEKRVALAFIELFEIEYVLVEGHRLLDVSHLDGDVIASVDMHTHSDFSLFCRDSSPVIRRLRNLFKADSGFKEIPSICPTVTARPASNDAWETDFTWSFEYSSDTIPK